MTQRQPLTHQEYLASLRFYSVSSIVKWASTFRIDFLDGDKDLPYVEKQGLYYYFGDYGAAPSHEYRLVCTADKDLGAEQ